MQLFKSPLLHLPILVFLCLSLGLFGGVAKIHPDTVLWTALRTFIDQGWNPHFFNYPGLVIYLQAITYAVIFALLGEKGQNLIAAWRNNQISDFTNLIESPWTISILFPAHLLHLFFSVLGVICVYIITYKVSGKGIIAFLAGLMVSTAFIWSSHAHYLTVDLPLAALCIATITITLIFTQEYHQPSWKELAIIGIMLGLTASAKYNGAFIFPVIVVALNQVYKQNLSRLLSATLIVVGFSSISFFVTNPFIVIDGETFQSFLTAILFELNHAKTGHFGYETTNGWWFHLSNSLYFGYGLIPLILAGIGVIGWRGINSSKNFLKTLLLIFPILYYFLVGGSTLAFQRYMLPVIPFLGIFSALGIDLIVTEIKQKNYLSESSFFIAIATTSFLMSSSSIIHHNYLLSRPDTRSQLYTLLSQLNLPTQPSTVYAGGYTRRILLNSQPNLSRYITNTSQKVESFQNAFQELSQQNQNLDLVIFDSFSHDRLLYSAPVKLTLPLPQTNALYVVQISPFNRKKYEVPFSPESLYAPYLPDLPYRKQPGPFIEIYTTNPQILSQLLQSCQKQRTTCLQLYGQQGYYYSEFQSLEIEEAT